LAAAAAGQGLDKDYGCRTLWAPRPMESFADIGSFSPDDLARLNAVITGGIMTGCQPGLFCPLSPVLRIDMAYFLINARHPSNSQSTPPVEPFAFGPATGQFEDVPVEHPLGCWAERFLQEGMTNGCALVNGRLFFCPQYVMTRGEMAVFLLRAKHGGSYTPPVCDPNAPRIFCDVNCNTQFAAYIEQLWLEGITAGCTGAPNRQFCSLSGTTRWEMMIFLDRTFLHPPASNTRRACTQTP